MRTKKNIRLEAARLAVSAPGDEAAATLFALAVMWECYLSHGADETQRRMKVLPEDSATILTIVPRQ
jgi:hypothetical protein